MDKVIAARSLLLAGAGKLVLEIGYLLVRETATATAMNKICSLVHVQF